MLAVESELPGHEVFYIASPDNVGGRDFGQILRQYYGDRIELRPVSRVDASGISSAKAHGCRVEPETVLARLPRRRRPGPGPAPLATGRAQPRPEDLDHLGVVVCREAGLAAT